MTAVTVDDILSDLPLGFASLILRPANGSTIGRFLIADAEDETPDGDGAFVLLIGVRGRSALPALRRLLQNPPPVVAVKGSRDELAEAEELLRDAGTGLLLVNPAADWDRLLSIAKDRIQPRSYQSEVLTLLEEDLCHRPDHGPAHLQPRAHRRRGQQSPGLLHCLQRHR
jgi:hypothetical protein